MKSAYLILCVVVFCVYSLYPYKLTVRNVFLKFAWVVGFIVYIYGCNSDEIHLVYDIHKTKITYIAYISNFYKLIFRANEIK